MENVLLINVYYFNCNENETGIHDPLRDGKDDMFDEGK